MSITTFFPIGHGVESISYLDSPQPCRQLTFSEIQQATENFDESLVVGRGGFGKVYKGTITNGVNILTVAIKRLDSTSNQGELEFWAEVKMLSKLSHCHLVSLIDYCNEQREMIIVYEYMPHGTLEDHLHKRLSSLPWVRRLKICIGAARGLDYLHTGTGIKHGVIHRDVKSSNILLDESWAAKVSDFGLSKIGPTNQPSTYVNTLVKGTFGYLDPDYYSTGRLTRKSDVYAFGVVLFEVLCGKRAVDRSIDEEQWGLASWAQDSIKEGRLKQIVDSNIRGRISPKCLKEFARLANRCLHSHPKDRPTMAEIVVGLEFVLALQEKANKTLQTTSMTIFGRKVPTFVFPYNLETSDGDRSLKSFELYFDTIQGENQIFRRFDFHTINVATENFSEANKITHNRFSSMYKDAKYSDSDFEEQVIRTFEAVASRRRYNSRRNKQRLSGVGSSQIHPSVLREDFPAGQEMCTSIEDFHSLGHASSQDNLESSSSMSALINQTSPSMGSSTSKPRVFDSQSANDSPGRPITADMHAFSESVKSKFSAASARYKESISKSTQGLKEKLLAKKTPVKELSRGVQREMSAGIAGVARMFERLDPSLKRNNG